MTSFHYSDMATYTVRGTIAQNLSSLFTLPYPNPHVSYDYVLILSLRTKHYIEEKSLVVF